MIPGLQRGQKSDWPNMLLLARVIFHTWKGAARVRNVLPHIYFQCVCSCYATRLSSPLSRNIMCGDATLVCEGPHSNISQMKSTNSPRINRKHAGDISLTYQYEPKGTQHSHTQRKGAHSHSSFFRRHPCAEEIQWDKQADRAQKWWRFWRQQTVWEAGPHKTPWRRRMASHWRADLSFADWTSTQHARYILGVTQ